jgi:hypothetical protein
MVTRREPHIRSGRSNLFVRHANGSPANSLREERERRRIDRAVQTARGERAPAMAVALAHIGAAFDEAAVINGFKSRVERMIALGPDHAAVRARYGARAAMLADLTLDQATARVERWWRDERKAFQLASVFGRATRLSLEVLRELRVILRLMRRKRMHDEYEAIREVVSASLRANGSGPKWPAR